MKVLIFPDTQAAEAHVAAQILDRVAGNPRAVLGLATGGTMERVYARLAEMAAQRAVPFDQVTSFNLDEYWGIAPDHACAYARYMELRVFGPLSMDRARAHLPDGLAQDHMAEAARYESAIAAAGGIDLQLLGLGANGHIGFNEPTSSLGSRTRLKTLTESTREANRRFFAPGEKVPRYAMTMGIGTILDSRDLLLLATGTGKARAAAQMIEGPLAAICPGSALQMHPSATVVLDRDAASALRLRDYYQMVHPDGAPARVPAGSDIGRDAGRKSGAVPA